MVRLELFENYKADQRIAMVVKTGQDIIKNTWDYDQFGRLAKITKGNDVVEYTYNDRGRVSKRIANHMETYYTYTAIGQLETKSLGAAYGNSPIASLKYFYANDGSIAAREVNGVKQEYAYDALGQLLSVSASGQLLEKYEYDPAGNMLLKLILLPIFLSWIGVLVLYFILRFFHKTNGREDSLTNS